jgi:hypothetical protein
VIAAISTIDVHPSGKGTRHWQVRWPKSGLSF